MARKSKYEEIAAILKNRILSGEYEPGQDFPTNKALQQEFDISLNTVQQAVYPLLQEGLVNTYGSGSTKRKVRESILLRSSKNMGILEDSNCRQNTIELKIVTPTAENKLSKKVTEQIGLPLVRYKTLQFRDGIPVAICDSYIPQVVPLLDLSDALSVPNAELYSILKSLGRTPVKCQESLYMDRAKDDECELFGIPQGNNLMVVRVTKRIFDEFGELLVLSFHVDRADAYEFNYQFDINC